MLARYELEQRNAGNIAAAEAALKVRQEFGDRPLPIESEEENRSSFFDPETRELLERSGLIIMQVEGETVFDLYAKWKPLLRGSTGSILQSPDIDQKVFSRGKHLIPIDNVSEDVVKQRQRIAILSQPSRSSEVAFHPEQLFLPGSEYKSYPEQMALMQDFSDALTEQGLNIQADAGTISEWLSILIRYQNSTKIRLIPDQLFTRTLKIGNVDDVIVGSTEKGISVWKRGPQYRKSNVGMAYLIFPR